MSSRSKSFRLPNISIDLPEIAESEKTPSVEALLGVIGQLVMIVQSQAVEIEQLKDEIAILKGQKPRPKIQASTLSKDEKKTDERNPGKRPGSVKLSKTETLTIHNVVACPATGVPQGSRFKGYQDWVVQDIKIDLSNTKYRRESWLTADGKTILGNLPEAVKDSHFGPQVITYVVYLHAQLRVTQPLILEHLLELGIQISSGQIDRILRQWGKRLEPESQDILEVGLAVAPYIQVDDTAARHKGQNGVCTQIGGEFFTWFASTKSKSRVNFLELLQAGKPFYVLNDFSCEYLERQQINQSVMDQLPWDMVFDSQEKWNEYLQTRGTKHRAREITEAALLGGLVARGFRKDLLIISDDAGQFNVFLHGLCWYHAERPLLKLIPLTDQNRQDLDHVRSEFWELYQALKGYRLCPSSDQRTILESRFDAIVAQHTSFQSLNLILERLGKNKGELLLVLEHPQLPLHNNGSEREIREYAIKRKISAGTRSDDGKNARDTLLTLKKTLRKLGLSFSEFLFDRISSTEAIPAVADLVRLRYAASTP